MEKFYINQPVAKGEKKPDKIDVFMSFLGYGKENAIKRDDLTRKCVESRLIKDSPDKENEDRAMRKLLKRAKLDYSITNDGDGKGYYRPTKEDQLRLERNNNRERKKGISTIAGDKVNRAIADDYKHNRLGCDA